MRTSNSPKVQVCPCVKLPVPTSPISAAFIRHLNSTRLPPLELCAINLKGHGHRRLDQIPVVLRNRSYRVFRLHDHQPQPIGRRISLSTFAPFTSLLSQYPWDLLVRLERCFASEFITLIFLSSMRTAYAVDSPDPKLGTSGNKTPATRSTARRCESGIACM